MAKLTIIITPRRPATLSKSVQCSLDGRIVQRGSGLLVEGQRC